MIVTKESKVGNLSSKITLELADDDEEKAVFLALVYKQMQDKQEDKGE